MELPAKVISDVISEEKRIYYFTPKSPIGIADHPHVCIKKKDDGYLFFVNCTSQEDTMNRLIKKQGLDESTIVWIDGDETNKLTKESSFINCNKCYSCTKKEFAEYYANKLIILTDGVISDQHYAQIVQAIKTSQFISEKVQELF